MVDDGLHFAEPCVKTVICLNGRTGCAFCKADAGTPALLQVALAVVPPQSEVSRQHLAGSSRVAQDLSCKHSHLCKVIGHGPSHVCRCSADIHAFSADVAVCRLVMHAVVDVCNPALLLGCAQ